MKNIPPETAGYFFCENHTVRSYLYSFGKEDSSERKPSGVRFCSGQAEEKLAFPPLDPPETAGYFFAAVCA